MTTIICPECHKSFKPDHPARRRHAKCQDEHRIKWAKKRYQKSKIPTTAELVKRGLAIDDEYKKPGNLKFGKSKGGK